MGIRAVEEKRSVKKREGCEDVSREVYNRSTWSMGNNRFYKTLSVRTHHR